MTGPAAPHGTTSTLPPPLSGLIAGCAVLVVVVIFIIQNAQAHHVEPSGWGRTEPPGSRNRPACQARTPRRPQAHTHNRQAASPPPIPLPVHPPRQMTHEKGVSRP
jgi:hypothetical protein